MAEEEKKRRGRGPDKQKRKSSPTGRRAGITEPVEVADGYNSNFISFMRAIMPTEELDYNDIPEMERRFEHYLDMCQLYDQKVGNMAAYAAIGIDKDTASDWKNRSANTERARFVKKVQKTCALYRESLMQNGQINPVTGIFWQKNYDGLKDQQDVVVSTQDPLGDEVDTERLKQKYLDSTYGQLAETAESTSVIDVEIAEMAESLK